MQERNTKRECMGRNGDKEAKRKKMAAMKAFRACMKIEEMRDFRPQGEEPL